MSSIDFGSVNNLYTRYLGRGASQGEFENWASGNYGATDLPGIERQISESGEAQDYRRRSPSTPPPTSTTQPVASNPLNTTQARQPNTPSGSVPGQVKVDWKPGTPLTNANLNQAYYTAANATPDNKKNVIAGGYQAYLGRAMQDQEYDTYWKNDTRPVEQILKQIYESGEAQAHRGGSGGGGTPPSGLPTLSGRTYDDNTILAYINSWANDPTADPSLKNDPGYWLRRIKETGGLGPDNTDYWLKASTGPTAFFRNPARETGGTPPPNTGIPGVDIPGLAAQFDDPTTKNFELWLNARLNELKQPVNDPMRDQLMTLLNQAIQKYQQPAYTGAEWEVYRTAALDPIEADRQAAQERVLQDISRRGMDPTSGIAQELINQTDRGFDTMRAKAQNELGYQRISEQRAREGEAIGLAGQAAGLSERIRQEQEARRQEAMSLASLLYQLPSNALQQAMSAAGLAPSPESLANTAIQLYGIGQQQRNQGLSWYETLGAALPYLAGAFGSRNKSWPGGLGAG